MNKKVELFSPWKLKEKTEIEEESSCSCSEVEDDMEGRQHTPHSYSSVEDDDDDAVDTQGYIIIPAKSKGSFEDITNRFFGDVTKSSAIKQFGIGGGTGWIAGYMANKIGKFAAISLAGTVVLVQVAQYNGYISVDWTKVQHALTEAQAKAKHTLQKRKKNFLQKSAEFYQENIFLSVGFGLGFLLGFIW